MLATQQLAFQNHSLYMPPPSQPLQQPLQQPQQYQHALNYQTPSAFHLNNGSADTTRLHMLQSVHVHHAPASSSSPPSSGLLAPSHVYNTAPQYQRPIPPPQQQLQNFGLPPPMPATSSPPSSATNAANSDSEDSRSTSPAAAPVKADARLVSAFEDLALRFLNCPDEGLMRWERLFFQIEAAHWHYMDFMREKDPKLPSMRIKEFTRQFFQLCPLLKAHRASADDLLSKFSQYKITVPVFGAIILNPKRDSCLLVRGMQAKSSWTFPKGKVNRDESELDCAIREVYEEVGFDCTGRVREDVFLTASFGEHHVKLYICPDVPEDTIFKCQTRSEIGDIQWFKIADLKSSSNFFLVSPFIHPLLSWISSQPKKILKRNEIPAAAPSTSSPPSSAPSSPPRAKSGSKSKRQVIPPPVQQSRQANSEEERQKAHKKHLDRNGRMSADTTPYKSEGRGPAASRRNEGSNSGSEEARPAKSESSVSNKQRRGHRSNSANDPIDRSNGETFGDVTGWGAEQMFETNRTLFGVTSNYSYDMYTTKLPSAESASGATTPATSEIRKSSSNTRQQRNSLPSSVSVTKGAEGSAVRTPSLTSSSCSVEAITSSEGGTTWSGFKFDKSAIFGAI